MNKKETSQEKLGFIIDGIYEKLRNSNPRGWNSVESYIIKDNKAEKVSFSYDGNLSEIQIIIICKECLKGIPFSIKIFEGSIEKKGAFLIGEFTYRNNTYVEIFPEEKKVKQLEMYGSEVINSISF